MSGRRKLNAEERALWARVAGTARPLARGARPGDTTTAKHRSPPGIAEAEGTIGKGMRETAQHKQLQPTKSQPSRPGRLDRRTEQRLRRGRLEVDARLDLHGMTQKAAHAALRRFFAAARDHDWRLVLVITGKGGSPLDRDSDSYDREPRGVLKRQVPLWLEEPDFAPFVAGYQRAHVRHGGDGALYVRLRRARD